MIIFGIGGTNGSGKDTVSHMLAERHGFFVGSASEMFEAELKKRGQPTEREYKRALSAEWRRQYGMAAVVDRAVEEAKAAGYDKVVIGSLRHPGEADRIHELGGQMIWVDADPQIRYRRITSIDRGRVEDKKTFEEFISEEEAEKQQSGDEATLSTIAVKERSDIFLENSTETMEEFKDKAETALGLSK